MEAIVVDEEDVEVTVTLVVVGGDVVVAIVVDVVGCEV